MNRNPATAVGPADMKEPYFSTPDLARITLKEKVAQQHYQANELENILREIETKLFGDIREDRGINNSEEVYKGVESVIIENDKFLQRCLELARSIRERI